MRQKSLQELVFVTLDPDEQAHCGTGPWLRYNAPPQPIVVYVDLNWGLPDLTHVWEQLRQTQGFLLAFATCNPLQMDTWLETEALLLNSKPNGMSLSRFFLRVPPPDGVEELIGWATILRFPDESPPAVVQRLLCSDAFKQGCLLRLPALEASCKQLDKSGNDLCPQQRGEAFHDGILKGFSIMSPLMAAGTVSMDFYLVEPESGTATLSRVIATAAVKYSRNANANGASYAPRVRTYLLVPERNNKFLCFVCFCLRVLSPFVCKL